MLIAELKGKIPSKLEGKEDILTSNVFSFFKYSERIFLKNYLNDLSINVSLDDAKEAIFEFWPRYTDGTEPDLVIRCGNCYILFEAKLYSDFSQETKSIKSQISRELTMGKLDADNEEREFYYVAITADYFKKKEKFIEFEKHEKNFIWTNWQNVCSFLENKITSNNYISDNQFGIDLYELLIKKKLRNFIGFVYRPEHKIKLNSDSLFYNLQSSKYKGTFTGFVDSLEEFETIKNEFILIRKTYFSSIDNIKITNPYNKIFYGDQ